MGIWDDFFSKAKSLFNNKEHEKPCYYELLNLEKNATDDDIKRAYKKMALKWHPDKNPERLEECTAYFILLQQAYEVLSDPQERAFYDKHRKTEIEKKDNGIKIELYFERNCFKGFNDDEQSFYSVYRNLFHKISAEEYAYIEDINDRNFPTFGNSNSTYEMIVDPFYSFWMDFTTQRSFPWLDKYDLRQAEDRATLRAMEKENKKLREIGKRKRNEEIQRLVMHIRKIDRRVKRNRELLNMRNKEQKKRTEEHRLQTIRKNLENLENYQENEEMRQEHLRHLEEIENQLDVEFGTIYVSKQNTSSSNDQYDNNVDTNNDTSTNNFYCVVCEKNFKSLKSYSNHLKSKKHKQQTEILQRYMKEEDKILFNESEIDVKDEYLQKKEKKKKIITKKVSTENKLHDQIESSNIEEINQESLQRIVKQEKFNDNKIKDKKKKNNKTVQSKLETPFINKSKSCERCGLEFESRTKLFSHLKQSGHATIKENNIQNSTKKYPFK